MKCYMCNTKEAEFTKEIGKIEYYFCEKCFLLQLYYSKKVDRAYQESEIVNILETCKAMMEAALVSSDITSNLMDAITALEQEINYLILEGK